MAVNLWDSSLIPNNEWESRTLRKVFGAGPITHNNTYQKYEDFEGRNYTFGLLYRPTQRLTVGAVYPPRSLPK